jgi:hypothetical protein
MTLTRAREKLILSLACAEAISASAAAKAGRGRKQDSRDAENTVELRRSRFQRSSPEGSGRRPLPARELELTVYMIRALTRSARNPPFPLYEPLHQRTLCSFTRVAVDGSLRSSRQVGWLK